MTDDGRERLREWLQSGRARLQPLSLTQQELWYAAPYPASDPSNHIGGLLFVRGPLRWRLLEQALGQVAARQEVLKLSVLQGRTEPVQLIREEMQPVLRADAGSDFNGEATTVEEASEAIFAEPFDLTHGPLYRVHVVERDRDDFVIVLTVHHAIADGWTIGVFMEDLWKAYFNVLLGHGTRLPPVQQAYNRWAAEDRSFWTADEIGPRSEFWKTKLTGARRLLDAPPQPSGRRRRLRTHLAPDRVERLRRTARKSGATLFSTLLAAFRLTLAEWRGAQDILVGTPVANRSRSATKQTMGSFAGLVPLRGDVPQSLAFADHVAAAQDDTAEAFARALPFVKLVETLGEDIVPGRNPVFDVRFALQNHPMPDFAYPGLSIRMHLLSTGTARFDLGCEVTEDGDQMEVVWLYRGDLFNDSEMESLDRLWCELLDAACSETLEERG